MGTMVPTATPWQTGGGVASAYTETRPSGEISLQKRIPDSDFRTLEDFHDTKLPTGKNACGEFISLIFSFFSCVTEVIVSSS